MYTMIIPDVIFLSQYCSGIAFPVQCKTILPVETVVIKSLSVRYVAIMIIAERTHFLLDLNHQLSRYTKVSQCSHFEE